MDEFNPEQFKLYENLDLFNMLNEDEAKECNISDDDDHDSDYIDPFDCKRFLCCRVYIN